MYVMSVFHQIIVPKCPCPAVIPLKTTVGPGVRVL